MHPLEIKILQVLGKASTEVSTTILVREIFREEYDFLEKEILSKTDKSLLVDNKKMLEAKRKKAQLHRKLLYHLNKLVDDGLIHQTKTEGKGEKYFQLNETNSNEHEKKQNVRNVLDGIERNYKTMLSGLEKYQEKEIISIYDEKNWTDKINTILLEPILKTTKLYELLNELYSCINDSIGIYDFQKVIETQNQEEINNFLNKINIDTTDYNKFVTITIDISNIKNTKKISSFLEYFCNLNPSKIICVLAIEKKDLKEHVNFFKEILPKFIEKKTRLNIQNKTCHPVPIIIGRAGTYSLKERDWEIYKKNISNKTIGICLSDTTIGIDVEKLYSMAKPITLMDDLFKKIAKLLIKGTSLHRRRSDILFEKINQLNQPNQSLFFSLTYNYIRLWNYKMHEEDADLFISKIKDISEETNQFSKTEETIFRSCGIPIHVDIVMSSAFKEFSKNFSSKKYNKTTIKSKEDLTSPEIMNYINKRNELTNYFICDRLRFFRGEGATPEKVIEEFKIIFENYRLPLVTYDFKQKKGNMTLSSFFN
jgi:hypothetical protein